MNKILFSSLLAVGMTGANSIAARSAPTPPQDGAPKPNIVFFIADDHSLRDSSVYGATDVRTPNMQRLSAAGITFNRAFVASPSCAPSRAAMLTLLGKDGAMTLAINGKIVARGKAAGPIAVQPAEELSIGRDTHIAVGDYTAPHPLKGKIENVKVSAQ